MFISIDIILIDMNTLFININNHILAISESKKENKRPIFFWYVNETDYKVY